MYCIDFYLEAVVKSVILSCTLRTQHSDSAVSKRGGVVATYILLPATYTFLSFVLLFENYLYLQRFALN